MLHRQKYFGGDAKGQVIFVVRCITESAGNENALIGPVVRAVSSCLTPALTDRGLEVIEAFDKIPMLSILETMRGLDLFSENSIGHYYSTAIRNKLLALMKPLAVLPEEPRDFQPRLPPKPPRSLTRIPEIERAIALGKELLALREKTTSNTQFGRQARAQFDVDQIRASRAMRVARIYGARPEIYRAVSWRTLVELVSPRMSQSVRQAFEVKILAGQSITAPQIHRFREPLRTGSQKRRYQQAMRAAA